MRQNLLEKRNQLEKDLLAENENVSAADKENQPAEISKNLAENKSIRRAFGGVKIVITEPPPSPQREDSLVTSKGSSDVLPKTSEKERENVTDGKNIKSGKEAEQKRNLREIIGGFGKKKGIKDVTIKNRHQVVFKSLLKGEVVVEEARVKLGACGYIVCTVQHTVYLTQCVQRNVAMSFQSDCCDAVVALGCVKT